MQKGKNIAKTLILIVVVVFLAFFSLRVATQIPLSNKPGNISHGEGRYMDIESYIKANISNLSPIKESLGGTFYVTHVETHGGVGTVSYEDGHNGYVADFTYSVSQEGQPSVESFVVRK